MSLLHVEDKLYVNSERVDKRREKHYGREVRIGVNILVKDWSGREYLLYGKHRNMGQSSPSACIRHQLQTAIDKLNVKLARLLLENHGGHGLKYYDDNIGIMRTYERQPFHKDFLYQVMYWYKMFVRADRPKLIKSEDECLSLLGSREEIQAAMVEAARSGLAEAVDYEHAEERARIANIILGHYIEVVDERARTVVRYKQRLAALTAELEAEYQTQCSALLEELDRDCDCDDCDIQWSDAPDFVADERSVKAALSKLQERVEAMRAPHRRSRFPFEDESEKSIKPEDVQ